MRSLELLVVFNLLICILTRPVESQDGTYRRADGSIKEKKKGGSERVWEFETNVIGTEFLGVILGVISLLLIAAVIYYACWRKRRAANANAAQPSTANTPATEPLNRDVSETETHQTVL